MIPWEHLASAAIPGEGIPGEGHTLKLMRRGDEYSIMIGGNELMNSRRGGSEEAMARLAAERVGGRRRARVLIGGLGLGFTLRAALRAFGADAIIENAELVPEVVDWARGPLAPVFGDCLADARVKITVDDVGAVIAGAAAAYDAILLDVDNGPTGLTRPENDRLYGTQGLAAIRRALKPRGVLVVWSASPDQRFTPFLRRNGFDADSVIARDHGKRGIRHTLWVATRRDGDRPAGAAAGVSRAAGGAGAPGRRPTRRARP
ncbi:MAG: spermidine synthase [Bauldia sp.]